MPQSFASVPLHLIFSTKNRSPVLDPEVCKELHPYLATALRENGSPSCHVGGVEDHVHILVELPRTISIAKLVETVKASSSKWVKGKGKVFSEFHWQSGYGAFAVNNADTEGVIKYIQNQAEHHRKTTFQEEYRKFLERHCIKFDERYMWD
jgi:REP element-mobilizing transposase RayT